MPPNRVFHAPQAHPAIRRAAYRLADGGQVGSTDPASAEVLVGSASELGIAPLPERTFCIARRGTQMLVAGDRPRSVLAGALYWLHHRGRGTPCSLPLTRTSPYHDRLVLEDFPYSCYGPTGLSFDRDTYAENLVALGYTAMECNRVSTHEPILPHFDGYQPVNPSPSRFVWTRWHEGVWERDIVAANAAELRQGIACALRFDLDPSATMFLPRPYPERFFARHPHLRGPSYEHDYLGRGGHPEQFSIDTDHADGSAFYEAVFDAWIAANPEILHYFFWHGDLGAQFWGDGQGPLRRRRMDRILDFHTLIDRLFRKHGCDPRVWINPWALPEHTLDELNAALPRRAGYATKDVPGAIGFYGSQRIRRIDATITSADIGDIASRVRDLARKAGRQVCLGQYHDFSEDVDPILGLPHPLVTYRKFKSLDAFSTEVSSTNWGIISPDLAPSRPNQDVLRELVWGVRSSCLEALLPAVLPAGLAGPARGQVQEAWRLIDHALEIWPQYWGLRIQGLGVRMRWLVRPFLARGQELPAHYRQHLCNRQIYGYLATDPFHEFMDLDPEQAHECTALFGDMITWLATAEERFASAMADSDGLARTWVASQLPPTRWFRLFLTTFRNLLAFHLACDDADRRRWSALEVSNTRAIIEQLRDRPGCLVIAGVSWGQCFGPDLAEDFQRKLEFMTGT